MKEKRNTKYSTRNELKWSLLSTAQMKTMHAAAEAETAKQPVPRVKKWHASATVQP